MNSKKYNEYLKQVVKLEKLYFPMRETTLSSLKKVIKNGGTVLYAFRKKKLCGYLILSYRGVYEYDADTLVVIPGYRNTGAGITLIQEAIKKATEAGGTCVFTYAHINNIPSINLLIKNGFRISKIEKKWIHLYYIIN